MAADYTALAKELRELEAKAEALRLRDGPEKLSREWSVAIGSIQLKLDKNLPTILAALEDAGRMEKLESFKRERPCKCGQRRGHAGWLLCEPPIAPAEPTPALQGIADMIANQRPLGAEARRAIGNPLDLAVSEPTPGRCNQYIGDYGDSNGPARCTLRMGHTGNCSYAPWTEPAPAAGPGEGAIARTQEEWQAQMQRELGPMLLLPGAPTLETYPQVCEEAQQAAREAPRYAAVGRVLFDGSTEIARASDPDTADRIARALNAQEKGRG